MCFISDINVAKINLIDCCLNSEIISHLQQLTCGFCVCCLVFILKVNVVAFLEVLYQHLSTLTFFFHRQNVVNLT